MAASASSSNTLGTNNFHELVGEGRKLAGYFFLDADALSHEVHKNPGTIGSICQVDQRNWWMKNGRSWSDSIQTGRAGTTLKTVSRALGSLSIGNNTGPYARTVDTNVIPYGCNIPVSMTYTVRPH